MSQLPDPITTWHYMAEDARRAIMFDARRLEAQRLARAAQRAAQGRK